VSPPIGQRVLQCGLVAYVKAIHEASRSLTIEFAKVYKRDATGALRQCHISVDSGKRYPADCSFDLVPEAGVITAEVPRDSITGMDAAVWCPIAKNYFGNVSLTGAPNDIAFGAEYALEHNQADHYREVGISYTEFIEAQVETPVYVVPIEIDAPRGMGMVTAHCCV
jgi:hypothetical protein